MSPASKAAGSIQTFGGGLSPHRTSEEQSSPATVAIVAAGSFVFCYCPAPENVAFFLGDLSVVFFSVLFLSKEYFSLSIFFIISTETVISGIKIFLKIRYHFRGEKFFFILISSVLLI